LTATDRSLTSAVIALSTTTAVQALVTMAALTVSVYAPQASRDIGIAPGYIGVYASLTYIGAMLGSLVSGGFILRYGAIRFSQAAMGLCALGLFVCVGAHWSWFVLSAFIFGIGYGPTTPASSYILSRHTPPRWWSLVFSVKQTGVPLGAVLAGLAVPWLLLSFSWQGVTVIVAGITLAGAIILQAWRRRFDLDLKVSQPLISGNVIGPLRLVFSRPGLRLLALASFFFSACQQSYIYFLVTYLEVGLGWTTRNAGFALSVLGLSAVAGRMAWGALADATGRSRVILGVIALAMTVATAATAAFTSGSAPWLVYVVCAVFGATGAAWNGVYLAEITRSVAPEEVGHATGGGLFVTFAGVVVAPPLFGLLSESAGGFAAGYGTMGVLTAVVGVVLLASRVAPSR
jgi:MFS family permease